MDNLIYLKMPSFFLIFLVFFTSFQVSCQNDITNPDEDQHYFPNPLENEDEFSAKPKIKLDSNVSMKNKNLDDDENESAQTFLSSFESDDEMTCTGKVKDQNLQPVLIGIFIESATPFLPEFLHKISLLDYPKNKLHIFLHNNVRYHSKHVKEFITKYKTAYASFKAILYEDEMVEKDARDLAVGQAQRKHCKFFLSVDSVAHLDNPSTLKDLVALNLGVVGPTLVQPDDQTSSNFRYKSQSGVDYLEVVNREQTGLWDVTYISGAYLVNSSILEDKALRPNYVSNSLEADKAFCLNNRNNEVSMYVTNEKEWGHLISIENFETTHLHNELYEIIDNRVDWEARYLHPNYSFALQDNYTVHEMMKDPTVMPCPDVFWFPIVTPRYCKELIEEMEHFGQWSKGLKEDNRLDGFKEEYPTIDIHLRDIGMKHQLQEFLRLYVEPLQVKVYDGFVFGPPDAEICFVARYRPDEQKELKEHHDESTYTINIALNTPHVDYEGGGVRFTRYNCSVVDTKLGYLLIHPGRITHQHEGLRIHKGTRYILVAFVDSIVE